MKFYFRSLNLFKLKVGYFPPSPQVGNDPEIALSQLAGSVAAPTRECFTQSNYDIDGIIKIEAEFQRFIERFKSITKLWTTERNDTRMYSLSLV